MLAYHETFYSFDSECKAFPTWWKWPSPIANVILQSLLSCSSQKSLAFCPF